MSLLKNKTSTGLLLIFTLILLICSATVEAQQKTKITGKMTGVIISMEKYDINDAAGHLLFMNKSEGIHTVNSGPDFLNNAPLNNFSFSDLIHGNGTFQGYMVVSKKSDSVTSKWIGQVTTKISSEGDPLVFFEGTYNWISGTGQYKNIQGSGTFKGGYLTPTLYVVEYDGEYFIKN